KSWPCRMMLNCESWQKRATGSCPILQPRGSISPSRVAGPGPEPTENILRKHARDPLGAAAQLRVKGEFWFAFARAATIAQLTSHQEIRFGTQDRLGYFGCGYRVVLGMGATCASGTREKRARSCSWP